MTEVTLANLVPAWRERAEGLAPYAPAAAVAFSEAAKELEEALAKSQAEELTLEEAAAESGYSADHLGRLLADGTIPNAGRKHAPRILRRDLPRKPKPPEGPKLAEAAPGGPSLARITRDAISSRTRRR
jgi:hypothetical protein